MYTIAVDVVIYETASTKNYCKPSQIRHAFQVRYSVEEGGAKELDGYGKWLIFRHFNEIDDVWDKIRTAIARGELKVPSAMCTTVRYNPSKHGPGATTTAKISVYTEEYNLDDIGFKLIEIAKQDLPYKTNEATKSYRYVHAGSDNVVLKTVYWNSGKPSFQKEVPCFATSFDIWQLNVVMAPEPNRFREGHSRWTLHLEFKEATILWHSLKDLIESKERNFGISKMVCPAKEEISSKEKPVFQIYTSREDSEVVKNLIAHGGIHYGE